MLALNFASTGKTLSYIPHQTELSTRLLNEKLAKEGRLYLPKVCCDGLRIFRVENMDKQLTIGFSGIWEPVEEFCEQEDPSSLEAILVPGIAFDVEKHRLGYGKGLYDRFLATLPGCVATCGIGFKEQFCRSPLPTHAGDVPVHFVALY